MAIPSTGSVSMTQIKNEYPGDSSPHQLSEFYRNGTYVKNWAAAQSIPTGGTIAFSNFRGTAASSNLSNAQKMQYIWDNKAVLFKLNNLGGTGTTVGGQNISMIYPFGGYLRAGEPNGGVAVVRNARGRVNGCADFTGAQGLTYLGPRTTFLWAATSYNFGVPLPTIAAFDKNNNEVGINEVYRSSDTTRGQVRIYQCDTDYNSFGYFNVTGGSSDLGRPGWAMLMMLPGKWDLWSEESNATFNPTTTPTYRNIQTVPNGISLLMGSSYAGNLNPGDFYNTSAQNPAGNWHPVEAPSRKIIRWSYYFDYHIEAALMIGTDGYEDNNWKHRVGTQNYHPFFGTPSTAFYRIIKLYRTGD